MSRRFIVALFVGCGLAAALSAAEPTLPHVTVTGTAVTQVTPNQMTWRLAVSNKGMRLAAVAEEHTKIVQQLLSFLRQNGLREADLQTAQMELGENWVYKQQSQVREGYVASTSVVFRTSDFATYKPLWLGLVSISGVSVNQVLFDHSQQIAHEKETRRKAVLAAREKAADIAKTLGLEIGEPLVIEEEQEGREFSVDNTFISTAEAVREQAALAPGTIPIRMRVKASFRLMAHK